MSTASLERRVREVWARKVAEEPDLAAILGEIGRAAEKAHEAKLAAKGKK